MDIELDCGANLVDFLIESNRIEGIVREPEQLGSEGGCRRKRDWRLR